MSAISSPVQAWRRHRLRWHPQKRVVRTTDPDIARREIGVPDLRHRILVGIALSGRFLAASQIGQRIGIEPGQRQIKVIVLQCGQFHLQHGLIPAGVLGDAVVAITRARRWVGSDGRAPRPARSGEPELCAPPAGHACHDDAVFAGQDSDW